jgi:hypothetical protein
MNSDHTVVTRNMARDIHRIAVKADILEAQILGHSGAA